MEPFVLNNIREQVNQKLGILDNTKAVLKQQQQELRAIEAHLVALSKAQAIVQEISQNIQQQVHTKIANIVSKCLAAVFDEPYEFKIIFEQKRGRTEASLVFERAQMQVDPLSSSGGGVVDVASFALRLACLLLRKPPLAKVLILDEPFKFVSSEYRENVRAMLEQLSKEMDIQFIMVTHIPELVAGKVIRLG